MLKFMSSAGLLIAVLCAAGCGSSVSDVQAEQQLTPPVPLGTDIGSLSPAETAMMESMRPGGEADPNIGQ